MIENSRMLLISVTQANPVTANANEETANTEACVTAKAASLTKLNDGGLLLASKSRGISGAN